MILLATVARNEPPSPDNGDLKLTDVHHDEGEIDDGRFFIIHGIMLRNLGFHGNRQRDTQSLAGRRFGARRKTSTVVPKNEPEGR